VRPSTTEHGPAALPTDPRWDDDDLNQMKRVPGSAFEAVEPGLIITR
jgi:hypothetical protein